MRQRAPSVTPSAAARAALTLASLLAVAGCSAPAPPPPAPGPLVGEWTLARSRWVGGALAGPRAGEASLDPTEARRISIEAYALDAPLDGGRPLAGAVRLGADLQGSRALGALNPLLTGGRLATGAEAQRWHRQLEGIEPLDARVEVMGRWHETLVSGGALAYTIGAIDLEGIDDDFLREFSERGPFPRRVDLLVAMAAEGHVGARHRPQGPRPGARPRRRPPAAAHGGRRRRGGRSLRT